MTALRREADLASHHPIGEDLLGDFGGGPRADLVSIAQNSDALADLHHLLQLVRDEDQGMTVPSHLPHDGEQFIHFLRRKDGGRLIEDQQRRAAVKRFDNFDALLLAHGELPDICIRVDLQAIPFCQFQDSFGDLVEVGQQPARGRQPQSDILRHRQRLDQHEVLMDHPDAEADRVGRGSDRDRFAVQKDLPSVRAIHPVEDLHQRAFASAVFAQQGMDFAGLYIEVHVGVGKHAGEALGNTAQFQALDPRLAGGEFI
jgi:hypothetical protein